MKGKFIKNPQLNAFQIPMVSVINMDHELVILAQRIDWKSVDNEFLSITLTWEDEPFR
jgi:hypothetical protein